MQVQIRLPSPAAAVPSYVAHVLPLREKVSDVIAVSIADKTMIAINANSNSTSNDDNHNNSDSNSNSNRARMRASSPNASDLTHPS